MNMLKTATKQMLSFLLCAVLAASALLPIMAYAEESSKTVRVGWFGPPFCMTDAAGRRSGYAYEYQQKIGAMDFIPKPYPDIEIVKARIGKCIELSEDRELIRYTERDKLTGLLNKDYFFRYVGRLGHLHKDTVLDAVVCDVNRFHAINKHYGRQFGDQALRSIGDGLKKLARETGGIVCREAGDTFLLYCPHQDDYEQMFREFLYNVFDGKDMAGRINLRFGVFTDARQEAEIEERFDRAKIAADRVKDDPQKVCGFYDLP